MNVTGDTVPNDDLKKEAFRGAKFLHAYLECSDEIQAGIREMLAIINSPDTDPDDLEMTLFTLADTLFPNFHEGQLGIDLEESEKMGASHSPEMKHVLEEMDREEQSFSENLTRVMKERNLTQASLAELVGIGQPAISNMLNRKCRPQRATVQRFADALSVAPQALWPNFQP